MSFCKVPDNLELHGANAVGPAIGELRPSFSLSKTETNGDLVSLYSEVHPLDSSATDREASAGMARNNPVRFEPEERVVLPGEGEQAAVARQPRWSWR